MTFKDLPSWQKGIIYSLIIWGVLSLIYFIYFTIDGGGKCSLLLDTPTLGNCFIGAFIVLLIGLVPIASLGSLIGYFIGATRRKDNTSTNNWKILLIIGLVLIIYGVSLFLSSPDLLDLIYIGLGVVGAILGLILFLFRKNQIPKASRDLHTQL